MTHSENDFQWMQRAIDLARKGQGSVEPNPMVGCVLVRDEVLIAEGFHEKFGGPHAEANALAQANSSGTEVKGATAFVTLEPCSHTGKTGPCADALIKAEIGTVHVAQVDPFEKVAGQGVEKLRAAGVNVTVGLLEDQARLLSAPYLKRIKTGLPWIIAKYAITLDGRIATGTGDSKWISSPESREVVHAIRGRVDGVLVGSGTVLADDPMLDARPPGLRVARRMVVDSQLRMPTDCQLAKTAGKVPVDVLTTTDCNFEKVRDLIEQGINIFQSSLKDRNQRLLEFLRRAVEEHAATNVLVEGGGELLGSLRELGQIDELHIFMGPKMIGGTNALSPVLGNGSETIEAGSKFRIVSTQIIGGDVYVKAMKA